MDSSPSQSLGGRGAFGLSQPPSLGTRDEFGICDGFDDQISDFRQQFDNRAIRAAAGSWWRQSTGSVKFSVSAARSIVAILAPKQTGSLQGVINWGRPGLSLILRPLQRLNVNFSGAAGASLVGALNPRLLAPFLTKDSSYLGIRAGLLDCCFGLNFFPEFTRNKDNSITYLHFEPDRQDARHYVQIKEVHDISTSLGLEKAESNPPHASVQGHFRPEKQHRFRKRLKRFVTDDELKTTYPNAVEKRTFCWPTQPEDMQTGDEYEFITSDRNYLHLFANMQAGAVGLQSVDETALKVTIKRVGPTEKGTLFQITWAPSRLTGWHGCVSCMLGASRSHSRYKSNSREMTAEICVPTKNLEVDPGEVKNNKGAAYHAVAAAFHGEEKIFERPQHPPTDPQKYLEETADPQRLKHSTGALLRAVKIKRSTHERDNVQAAMGCLLFWDLLSQNNGTLVGQERGHSNYSNTYRATDRDSGCTMEIREIETDVWLNSPTMFDASSHKSVDMDQWAKTTIKEDQESISLTARYISNHLCIAKLTREFTQPAAQSMGNPPLFIRPNGEDRQFYKLEATCKITDGQLDEMARPSRSQHADWLRLAQTVGIKPAVSKAFFSALQKTTPAATQDRRLHLKHFVKAARYRSVFFFPLLFPGQCNVKFKHDSDILQSLRQDSGKFFAKENAGKASRSRTYMHGRIVAAHFLLQRIRQVHHTLDQQDGRFLGILNNLEKCAQGSRRSVNIYLHKIDRDKQICCDMFAQIMEALTQDVDLYAAGPTAPPHALLAGAERLGYSRAQQAWLDDLCRNGNSLQNKVDQTRDQLAKLNRCMQGPDLPPHHLPSLWRALTKAHRELLYIRQLVSNPGLEPEGGLASLRQKLDTGLSHSTELRRAFVRHVLWDAFTWFWLVAPPYWPLLWAMWVAPPLPKELPAQPQKIAPLNRFHMFLAT